MSIKNLINRFKNGSWNYRFLESEYIMDEATKLQHTADMRKLFGPDYVVDTNSQIFYELIEVYYDENNKIIAWSDSPVSVWCNSVNEMESLFKRYKKALKQNTVKLVDGALVDSKHKMNRSENHTNFMKL